jgi:hypothetical protein
MNPFEDFLTGQKLAGQYALPTKPPHGSEGGIGRQTLEMAENTLIRRTGFRVWTHGAISRVDLQWA